MCSKVNKSTTQVKASCYLWDNDYEGEPDEFSIVWGIIENLETRKTAVKFIVELEDK